MPFVPHTQDDIQKMLAAIDITDIDQVFDEVPASMPKADLSAVPEGLDEMSVSRLLNERAPAVNPGHCFIGAGAYEHYIPAAVWQITTRGEYYTAYTPYQAEASQGSLQLIYEYQTMMANLMAMEVSNASLYEGASALSEAILMSVRVKRSRAKRVLVPASVNPTYRKVLNTVLGQQGIVVENLPFDPKTGAIDCQHAEDVSADGLAAVVISQPNFFGTLEDVDRLTDWAHQLGALVIAVVNPVAMALLKPPGQWGQKGADIVCGEGQPLGVPLSSGGPYFGFMCTTKALVRQLPGRIVGRTHDGEGREGFTLTLQAREQHIRRAKATSNICTNQGLMVTAATIHMSLLGAEGLRRVAAASHHNAKQLCERLKTINGVTPLFDAPMFHEFVLKLDKPVDEVMDALSVSGLQAGYALKPVYPELGECLLVCATETKTEQDLERYQQLLAKAMQA